MGLLAQRDNLGLEASGIVRAVGPGPHQQEFREGDCICVFGSSLLRTSVTIPSSQCFLLPSDISLENAATIPCVYATVVYSLTTLGALEKGQVGLLYMTTIY